MLDNHLSSNRLQRTYPSLIKENDFACSATDGQGPPLTFTNDRSFSVSEHRRLPVS